MRTQVQSSEHRHRSEIRLQWRTAESACLSRIHDKSMGPVILRDDKELPPDSASAAEMTQAQIHQDAKDVFDVFEATLESGHPKKV